MAIQSRCHFIAKPGCPIGMVYVLLSVFALAAAPGQAALSVKIPLENKDAGQDVADLIIRNGRVVDGTGNPWYYADVAIYDGRIMRVGNLSAMAAKEEIDANGLVVAPGFIDVHTHADEDLISYPYAENFVRDGVTTLIGGNCGTSPINLADYFRDATTTGTAVNMGMLVGHNSVLRRVKGDVATPLTESQLEAARELIRRAMREGAFGMSTGLIYTPGKFSTTEEIIALQKEAAALGGMYVTHMRSETSQILEAVDEALRIGREAGCRVHISHLKLPTANRIGGSDTLLRKILDARAAGQEVLADQYPYTASSTSISALLPDELLETGSTSAQKSIADPAKREEILEWMKRDHERGRGRKDFAYPQASGKSILEVARIRKYIEQHPEVSDWNAIPADQLPEVTLRDQYLTILDIYSNGGAGCVFHTQNEKDMTNIMRCPLVAVASDSGIRVFGSGKPHPRGYGTNARVLGRYAREQGVISLEEAVRKMTSLPARAFRFRDRGEVRPGAWADLTLFNPETVLDLATYDDPHQYSTGIEYVVVNGQIVLARGTLTGKRPGHMLYGPAHPNAQTW
jgi:N-acyl-D-amino-acid deacylase